MVWRTANRLPLDGPRECPIPNAALNRLRIAGDAIEILAWGDDAHVADLAAPAGAAPAADTADALQDPPSPSSPSAR
jgi:hypothetical protein